MLAILLTHAEAEKVKSGQFRALSDKGRDQISELARRFPDVVTSIAVSDVGSGFTIGNILSSPAARCVESVLLLAHAVRELTSSSDLEIRHRLKEKRGGQLSGADLVSVLDETAAAAALICTHGDLAGALPSSATVRAEYAKGGFFEVRPVLTIVSYERGSKWDEARVLYCSSPSIDWKPCLKENEPRD